MRAGDPFEQLGLPLPPPGDREAAPVAAPENAEARAVLDAVARGDGGVRAVIGPPGAGKTAFLERRPTVARLDLTSEGATARALALLETSPAGCAVDDADALWRDAAAPPALQARSAEALFHLLNRAERLGAALVLLGREPPSHWTPPLPDLRSRLAVLPIARIERPDDALLRALLHAAFRRRGLAVGDRVVGYLVARMPRDYASVESLAAALDRASLARRSPVTTTLAAALFGWGGSAW